MTKCNRSEVNLKSTAYNQNGQNFFEQLAAYNSMSSHLRRILMAKCVVDATNKNYMRKRKRFCNKPDCKPQIVKKGIRDDIIDRLAYDTLHHPADFLRMSYDSGYLYQRENHRYFADCYDYDVIYSQPRLQNRIIYSNSPIFKANKSESFICNDEQMNQQATKTGLNIQNTSEHRYKEDSITYKTTTDFLTQEMNHLSMAVNSSRSYDKFKTPQVSTDMNACNQETCIKNEEAKYVKFVYEITCEIIHNGLYSDEQLRDVFRKHLEKNKAFLSMNKMLYEICQLKLSLNVSDDSDSEESENFVPIRQFNISKIRPPTSPKVSNENKDIEEFHEIHKGQCKSDDNNTLDVLIDINPELDTTERNVLSSLIESNINPEQAEKVCKRLSSVTKDATSIDLIQTRPEQSNDDNTPSKSDRLDFSSKRLNNMHKINEQEKSSGTGNLIILEDKEVQK